MKKLFIIGTGRNGSKLTGRIIGTTVDIKYRQGERHHGLEPIFFKRGYLGDVSKEQVIKKFKASRDKPIKNCPEIYVEKNHLIVPILEQVLEAYPDALFLYTKRNTKAIIRSLYARDVYSGAKNKYEEGRLTPKKDDVFYNEWHSMSKFEKVCWYVYTMTKMCGGTLSRLPDNQYRIISYEEFVKNPIILKDVFGWLELDFDLDKVKDVLGTQIGSSARTVEELNFKVNKTKVKNTEHWENWSDEKKEAYNRFFE